MQCAAIAHPPLRPAAARAAIPAPVAMPCDSARDPLPSRDACLRLRRRPSAARRRRSAARRRARPVDRPGLDEALRRVVVLPRRRVVAFAVHVLLTLLAIVLRRRPAAALAAVRCFALLLAALRPPRFRLSLCRGLPALRASRRHSRRRCERIVSAAVRGRSRRSAVREVGAVRGRCRPASYASAGRRRAERTANARPSRPRASWLRQRDARRRIVAAANDDARHAAAHVAEHRRERDVGGVAAGADADQAGQRRDARRVEQPPAIADVRLDVRVEIRRAERSAAP